MTFIFHLPHPRFHFAPAGLGRLAAEILTFPAEFAPPAGAPFFAAAGAGGDAFAAPAGFEVAAAEAPAPAPPGLLAALTRTFPPWGVPAPDVVEAGSPPAAGLTAAFLFVVGAGLIALPPLFSALPTPPTLLPTALPAGLEAALMVRPALPTALPTPPVTPPPAPPPEVIVFWFFLGAPAVAATLPVLWLAALGAFVTVFVVVLLRGATRPFCVAVESISHSP